jgi:ribosome-associated protein
MAIEVGGGIEIQEREIGFEFVRASGPGGQNVNKVATAVKLRFDVGSSPSLSSAVKLRLRSLAGRRLSAAGILVIDARRFRTQEANRRDALERLLDLVRRAAAPPPPPRRPTRPGAAARARRLDEKRRRGEVKQARRKSFPASD